MTNYWLFGGNLTITLISSVGNVSTLNRLITAIINHLLNILL